MKKLIICLFALAFMIPSFGQSRKEQIQSAKIAFFTTEIGLTPEEAQVFWPVYNQSWEERQNAHIITMKSFSTLRKIEKQGNTSEADIKAAIKNYLANSNTEMALSEKWYSEFEKILSPEKLLKYYLAEEDFRYQMIKMWREPKGNKEQEGK